ncbi:MAG: hypothetical protein QHH09_01325 [Microgenomates group bacterium]|nr:hypothetical protein [Microgenomates group bacterium]
MPKSKDLKNKLMEEIKSEKIKMKPRWHFILGSIFLFFGTVAATISSIFIFNLLFFLLRKHYGPMYHYRLQLILSNFPWWFLVLAVLGIVAGIKLLKNYDFSYKKNFLLIVIGYILVIILSAFIIDYLNLNKFFFRPGWRRFYLPEKNFNKDFQPGLRQNSWRWR